MTRIIFDDRGVVKFDQRGVPDLLVSEIAGHISRSFIEGEASIYQINLEVAMMSDFARCTWRRPVLTIVDTAQ